jgi:hypothetical protein
VWKNGEVGVRVAHSKYSHSARFELVGETPVLSAGNYFDVLDPATGVRLSHLTR